MERRRGYHPPKESKDVIVPNVPVCDMIQVGNIHQQKSCESTFCSNGDGTSNAKQNSTEICDRNRNSNYETPKNVQNVKLVKKLCPVNKADTNFVSSTDASPSGSSEPNRLLTIPSMIKDPVLEKALTFFFNDKSVESKIDAAIFEADAIRDSIWQHEILADLESMLIDGFVHCFPYGSRSYGIGTGHSDLNILVDICKYNQDNESQYNSLKFFKCCSTHFH